MPFRNPFISLLTLTLYASIHAQIGDTLNLYPEQYQLMFRNDYYRVGVVNNELKLLNMAGESLSDKSYHDLEARAHDYCSKLIKADNEYFFPRCDYSYEAIGEIEMNQSQNIDSINALFTGATLESKTWIKNDYLYNSFGYRKYFDLNTDEDFLWWYRLEGNSGIYDLVGKKWIIEPIHHSLDQFGRFLILHKAHQEDSSKVIQILNPERKPFDEHNYTDVLKFNDHLLLRDENGRHSRMDTAGNVIFFDASLDDLYTQVVNGFLSFGTYYKNDYTDYASLFQGKIYMDDAFETIQAPDGYEMMEMLHLDFAIFYHPSSKQFVLYDWIKKGVVDQWELSYKSFGYSIQIGEDWDFDVRFIDLEELRKEE